MNNRLKSIRQTSAYPLRSLKRVQSFPYYAIDTLFSLFLSFFVLPNSRNLSHSVSFPLRVREKEIDHESLSLFSFFSREVYIDSLGLGGNFSSLRRIITKLSSLSLSLFLSLVNLALSFYDGEK